MTYKPQPTKVEGGETKARVSDDNVEQLLAEILVEIRKINTQLAMMTDNIVSDGEIH